MFSYLIQKFSFTSGADADAANAVKTLLDNGLGTFPIKVKPAFNNDLKVYLKILLIVLFYAI